MDLSDLSSLRDFLAVETPLMRAIKLFTESQRLRYQEDCTQYMAIVPRDSERASDAAAHSDAYATWMEELKHFAQNHRP